MSDSRERQIDYAAEVFIDFLATAAEGKDDDEVVFWEADVRALAEACGVDDPPEVEPMTAGEIRRRTRAAKAALARGEGPSPLRRVEGERT